MVRYPIGKALSYWLAGNSLGLAPVVTEPWMIVAFYYTMTHHNSEEDSAGKNSFYNLLQLGLQNHEEKKQRGNWADT